MIVARHAISDPNKAAERAEFFEQHRAYLRQAPIRILLSGASAPPVDGDRASALLIADAESLKEFIRFSDGDPFIRTGVYRDVIIFEWRPTIGILLAALRDTI
ncbi:MAG: YciI family protein [Brucella sp.]